jgi:DNA-binding NtrC family response regulator
MESVSANINILVVDDKEEVSEPIAELLRSRGYKVQTAVSGPAAIAIFNAGAFDLVVSDFNMRPMNGIELLTHIKRLNRDVPFLIFTGCGDIKTAVEAMEKGAFTFLEKDNTLSQKIEVTVKRALEHRSLITENKKLKGALALGGKSDYVGQSPALQKIREFIATVAPTRSTVLITGESGTGKELIARSIHVQSPRGEGPFVKINCASIPEGLVESELFGHVKGSFTGALKDKIGKFQAADGGTLLLDEIGEMPMNAQAKLLRAIQEKEIQKVGGDDPVKVDVRILAASNRNLEEEIGKGAFREDLYYRLKVFHVHLPPLRERKDDVARLAEHFIDKYNKEYGFSVEGLSDEGVKELLAYKWPGNIRELEHAIERAVVLTRSGPVSPGLFGLAGDVPASAPGKQQQSGGLEAGITISEAEKQLIIKTLEHCGHNKTKAAEMLDISIRTLRNKLNEYALGGDE